MRVWLLAVVCVASSLFPLWSYHVVDPGGERVLARLPVVRVRGYVIWDEPYTVVRRTTSVFTSSGPSSSYFS